MKKKLKNLTRNTRTFIKKNPSATALAAWAIITLLTVGITSCVQKYFPALYSEAFAVIAAGILVIALFNTCVFVYCWDYARHIFSNKED